MPRLRAEVGYDPEHAAMLPVPEGRQRPHPIATGRGRGAVERLYVRCVNFATPAVCNWLVPLATNGDGAGPLLCRSCRLTRTVPDLADPVHGTWWARIEHAKRQLVSTLVTLGLPVCARVAEDTERGLVFDLLRSPPGGPRVITGHAQGVVTVDVEEADDATRERRRADLREPYRTLLGHLRHEIGHYYWYRLIADSKWLEPFRALFGDERAQYTAALRRHYENGPSADWPQAYVSAYASAHPWEDWAEKWAHYLHMIDALDTALSFGVGAQAIEAKFEPFDERALSAPRTTGPAEADTFLVFVNAWVELATALNELSRSMGQPDFYPFVLSTAAVRKLHLVHRVVNDRGRPRRNVAPASRIPGTPLAPVAH